MCYLPPPEFVLSADQHLTFYSEPFVATRLRVVEAIILKRVWVFLIACGSPEGAFLASLSLSAMI